MISIVPGIKSSNKAQDKKVQNNVNNAVNTDQEQKEREISKVNSIPIVNRSQVQGMCQSWK